MKQKHCIWLEVKFHWCNIWKSNDRDVENTIESCQKKKTLNSKKAIHGIKGTIKESFDNIKIEVQAEVVVISELDSLKNTLK
jgi:gas vesicle protein